MRLAHLDLRLANLIFFLTLCVLAISGIRKTHLSLDAQTPANVCPANQYVNSQLANTGQSCALVAYSGLTGTPAIPAAQVNSDWNASSGVAQILNKPSLAAVATTGAYSSLTGLPTIPTQTSQLTNNSGFLTAPVANASLANSAITINGVSVPLGGTVTTASQQIQNLDFTNQPGLFSTATATSNVYFEPNAATLKAVVTREQGSPICTAAPVAVILDLGTSPSTSYASATVLFSQTLSTSNTVASNTGLSVAVASGHYLGYGFSGGTCVTPPTVTTSIVVQ
jgi:hypothetical protein